MLRVAMELCLSELFRKEALAHHARKLSGDVILVVPLPVSALTSLAVAVLLVVSTFVATANYSRKETVVGWLTPRSGIIRATAARGGVVENLRVTQGDSVAAGSPLADIRLPSDLPGGDSSDALIALLEQQIDATRQSASSQARALNIERRNLSERVAILGEDLDDIDAELALHDERVELAESEVERALAMKERGYLSNQELEERRTTLLIAQQSRASLLREASRTRLQQQAAEAQLETIPLRIAAAEAESASELAVLAGRNTEVEARSAYVVVSPIDAQVAALPVREGQALQAGGAVAVLVSSSDRLIAELYVPSRAAGFIREGQAVRLSYDAFPHQRFGVGSGEVALVSSTVLAPSEISNSELNLREPVFRVEVELEQEFVVAYGERIELQPGMLLRADIILERQTLVQWLFDPIFAAVRR